MGTKQYVVGTKLKENARMALISHRTYICSLYCIGKQDKGDKSYIFMTQCSLFSWVLHFNSSVVFKYITANFYTIPRNFLHCLSSDYLPLNVFRKKLIYATTPISVILKIETKRSLYPIEKQQQNIYLELQNIETSLSPPLFNEVAVPSQEGELPLAVYVCQGYLCFIYFYDFRTVLGPGWLNELGSWII